MCQRSRRSSRITISRVSASAAYVWLPAGRRGFGTVWPGILATMVLWLICGFTFGHYLAEFAYTYVNYYAGLAPALRKDGVQLDVFSMRQPPD